MIAALYLGLATASLSGQIAVEEAIAVERFSQCGVRRTRIDARTDKAGAIELSVSIAPPSPGDDAPISPDIDCLVLAAIDGSYRVAFEDNYIDEQFQNAYNVLNRARTKITATRWLVERGLFETLPAFDPDTDSLASYAREIEVFCKIAPGTVVRQYDIMVLAYRKRVAGSPVTDTQIECLSQAFGASNLNEDYNEFFFGFVVDQAGVAAEGQP